VIVRIATEGQYKLSDDVREQVNELDNQVVAAVEADDEARFQKLFQELLDLVRAQGSPLDDDELVESDVIIPPPDLTIEEAKADFVGEGLIPD
jgi:hypothetical protein